MPNENSVLRRSFHYGIYKRDSVLGSNLSGPNVTTELERHPDQCRAQEFSSLNFAIFIEFSISNVFKLVIDA